MPKLLAGMQQNRESASTSMCGAFYRLASGADAHGNFGVELRFNGEVPFAWVNQDPAFLRLAGCTMIRTCPTSMIARLSHPALDPRGRCTSQASFRAGPNDLVVRDHHVVLP